MTFVVQSEPRADYLLHSSSKGKPSIMEEIVISMIKTAYSEVEGNPQRKRPKATVETPKKLPLCKYLVYCTSDAVVMPRVPTRQHSLHVAEETEETENSRERP